MPKMKDYGAPVHTWEVFIKPPQALWISAEEEVEKYETELVDHDSQETASYMQSRTGKSEMLGCDNK